MLQKKSWNRREISPLFFSHARHCPQVLPTVVESICRHLSMSTRLHSQECYSSFFGGGGFFFLFFPISKYKNLTMDIKILFFAWETFWLDSLMIIFLTNNIFSKRNNLSWNNSFQILLDFSFLKYLKCACVFFFLIYLMRNKYFKF